MGRQLPPRLVKPKNAPYQAMVRDRNDWSLRHPITINETLPTAPTPREPPLQDERATYTPVNPGVVVARFQTLPYDEPRGWDYMTGAPRTRPRRVLTVVTPARDRPLTTGSRPIAPLPNPRPESRLTSRGHTVQQRMAAGPSAAPVPNQQVSAGPSYSPRRTRQVQSPRRETSPEILYPPEAALPLPGTAFRRAMATPQSITAPPPRTNTTRPRPTTTTPARSTAQATAASQRLLAQAADHIRAVRAAADGDDDRDTESDTATEVDDVPPEVADPHAAYLAYMVTNSGLTLSEEGFNIFLRIIRGRFTLQAARDAADQHSIRHITAFPVHMARFVANGFHALIHGSQAIIPRTIRVLREVEDHIPHCTGGPDCDLCHLHRFTGYNM